MKIGIVNRSGNTGKTTLAKHLLIPNLPGAKRIEIEDVNAGDGVADVEINAKQLKELASELLAAEEGRHFVIDVGSSLIKDVTQQLAQLKSLRRDVDLWIVPVTKERKQKVDSIETLKTLKELGVPTSQIFLLPNKIEDVQSFDADFEEILGLREIGAKVSRQAVLSSEVFEMLKEKPESVYDIARNAPDFKALKREAAGNKDALLEIGQRIVLQDMAEFSVENLDSVWNDMMEQTGLAVEA